MKACTRSSVSRLSSPIMTVASPSSRTRSTTSSKSVTSGTRKNDAGFMRTASSSSRSWACRYSRSHGTPPNCSACVISCSATQRSSWSAGASSDSAACARLGATNSSRAGWSGSSTGNSYCPSTRPARKPLIAPASTAITPPARIPSGPSLHADPLRRGLQHRLERHEVRVDPALALDRLGDRHGLGGDEAGVGGDETLGLRGRLGQLLERLRVAGGLQIRDAAGHGRGELPVDHLFQDARRSPARAKARPGLGARTRVPRACGPRSRANAARGRAARPADRRRR